MSFSSSGSPPAIHWDLSEDMEEFGGGGGASFPVVFYDGVREVDLGPVAVLPSLGFRKLQVVISERIGVAPHQIATSLVRRKQDCSSPDVRRRVPIDEESDLAAIAREQDCFLLAVLRRSRRERRGRSRLQREAPVPPPERTILRRSTAVSGGGGGDDHGTWDYEEQMRELQRQRKRYLMSSAGYYPYPAEVFGGYQAAPPKAEGPPPECEECLAKGAAAPFHWCVRDAVTVGFRTPAGPIQRPPKSRVQSSAYNALHL